MSYVPGQIVEGQLFTDQGFVDLTQLPKGSQYGSFSGSFPGIGRQMFNPLQPLSGALSNLAMQDSSEAMQQKVGNTMTGIVSLIDQSFPTFSTQYGGGGYFKGDQIGGGGGILSFGVPDAINDPINYPENPMNNGTFDPSNAMKMLGQLTGVNQTPLQATNVSSMPGGIGGIGSMLGSLM